MSAVTATQRIPARTACPACGASCRRGQLVCLECGSRVALAYRPPSGLRVPGALLVAMLGIALLVGAVAYWTFAGSDETVRPAVGAGHSADAKAAAAAALDLRRTAAALNEPLEPLASRAKSPAAAVTGSATSGLERDGATWSWPKGLPGWTVVLLTSSDRPGADAAALAAAGQSDTEIGVLRSDDFGTLGSGQYLVFAGRYADRAAALSATSRLGQHFQGAYPQQVGP